MVNKECRNYLKELGYKDSDIEKRIQETWTNMFEGPEDERIYFESGEKGGYLLDTGNHDVRSEGQSYGMMMSLMMDRRDIFDRIWKWTMDHMYITEGHHRGYFAWSWWPDGTSNSDGPAPDGEEFFAMALLFASKRWGDGEGIFEYSRQAKDLLRRVIRKGEHEGGMTLFNTENYQVKFIAEVEFTDPSYHLPHFYEYWALWCYPEDREFWLKAAEVSREFLPKACHPETGLSAEYSFYDGSPNHYNGFGHFYSDSYRVAANLGVDALWNGPRFWQKKIIDNLQHFFKDIKPEEYRRYAVDGTPLDDKCLHPTGLLATLAAGSLATSGNLADEYVRRFWNTPLRKGDRRYFDNCLYLFALLALSGRYRPFE